VTALELGAASRILRDALKDKSYRSTPLGLEVARYVRWFRSEWGATSESVRDYESILARLALFCSDLELSDMAPPVGTERLRECWDFHWGDAKPRTREGPFCMGRVLRLLRTRRTAVRQPSTSARIASQTRRQT
jgi:hypothetical protein